MFNASNLQSVHKIQRFRSLENSAQLPYCFGLVISVIDMTQDLLSSS